MAISNASKGQMRRLIGRQGENIAKVLLENLELTPRKDEVDDGEDFWIELSREDGLWERIGVQVKASESYRPSANGSWKVKIKASRVTRYRQAAHPIVVLAVNVKTNEIRWAAFSEDVGERGISLSMPPDSALTYSDGEAFRKALRNLLAAHHAMVNPPSRTLLQQEASLRDLDYNIDVKLTASREGTKVELGISFETTPVEIAGDPVGDVAASWAEAWRYGTPTTLTWKNARLAGSPLLEALTDAPQLSIEVPANGGAETIRIGWRGADETDHWAITTLGWKSMGAHGVLVRLDSPTLPLHFEGRWPLEPGPPDVQFALCLDPWTDAPFARLPYWDGTWSLIEALARGKALILAFQFDGYDSDPLVLGSDGLRQWALGCLRHLTPLHTFVAAARHTKSEATLTGDTIVLPKSSMAMNLDIVSRLLNNEVIAVPPIELVVADGADVSDHHECKAQVELTWHGELVASLPVEYLLQFYAAVPCEANTGLRLVATEKSETYLRLAQHGLS